MKTLLRKLRARRGNAIVELALVLPIITGSAIFIADVGTAAYRNMTLKSAVRAGADYAVRYGDTSGIAAAVAAAANRDPGAISVTTSQFCGCDTTTVTCGGTCTGGTTQQVYMTVSVSEPYSAMIRTNGVLGVNEDGTRTLQAQATFRLK